MLVVDPRSAPCQPEQAPLPSAPRPRQPQGESPAGLGPWVPPLPPSRPAPSTQEAQEAALYASPRVTAALGPELLDAFLAVRRSDAHAAADRELDQVLADLRWRY